MAARKSNKPPKNFKDITGQKFGRLTVIALLDERGKNWGCRWDCLCECGGRTVLKTNHLVGGVVKSCGCLQRLAAKNRLTTHGMRWTPEYIKWKSAKDRCFRANCAGYPDYGGRGITMCEEWRNDFTAFFRDMGPCPKGMTLERRDVNGNYTPDNCYWATPTEQARNKRTSLSATHNGETLSLVEWSERTGIAYHTLRRRHKAGKQLF